MRPDQYEAIRQRRRIDTSHLVWLWPLIFAMIVIAWLWPAVPIW
jgi:hypothetical protein